MNDANPSWRHTAKTILLTAVFTSALWAIGVAYFLIFERPEVTAISNATPVEDSGMGDDAALPDGTMVTRAPSPEIELPPAVTSMLIPVTGVAARDLVDTFTQARAGGARVHDAIDIMADDGTPVVAAGPGTVEKLFLSENGGITAYIRSPDKRWIHYYAHLKAYAPGLKEGDTLRRGDPVGTIGSTGNASPDGPHLHFAVHRMEDGEGWHEGTPVNPYPLLTAR